MANATNAGAGAGAGGRSRTDTWLPMADFESAASTNSATPAGASAGVACGRGGKYRDVRGQAEVKMFGLSGVRQGWPGRVQLEVQLVATFFGVLASIPPDVTVSLHRSCF
jgi:hypothetical protein